MAAQIRAGIELRGKTLRYAEVERTDTSLRLIRLGSCDFDFDVERELAGVAQPVWIDTVTEALGDVFAGSTATHLRVALHPSYCASFFSMMPTALPEPERAERLQWEAALLADEHSRSKIWVAPEVIVRTETPAGGEPVDWVHVLAVRERVHTQFKRMVGQLSQARCELDLSTRLVGGILARIEQNTQQRPAGAEDAASAGTPAGPFTLAVGWYPAHTEYTLCKGQDWHYSHHTVSGPAGDCAYFAAALLDRLGLAPTAVGQVYLYGEDFDRVDFAPLQVLFRTTPQPLNPLGAFNLNKEELAIQSGMGAFAPVIGAAL